MEKRLELERRGRNPDQIKELNLDNARSVSIVGLTDEYLNLESLSLINVGLSSLKGFPNLPKLRKLELSDNRIQNSLECLKGCPNLKTLNLCNNKISEFKALEPLKEFKHLESLDLFSCDVTQTENYREKVFNLISSLKYLDGFDSKDNEKDASEIEDDEDSESQDLNDDEDSDIDEDDEDQIVDEDESDEASESDVDEEEVGLSALIGDDINEEEDEENLEYEPNETNGNASDSDIESDADDEVKDISGQEQRGQKRKHEAEAEEADE